LPTYNSPWTQSAIDAAIAILGRHASIVGALPEISALLDEPTSPDALRKALTSRGLGAPSGWLRGGAAHGRTFSEPSKTSAVAADDRRSVTERAHSGMSPGGSTTRILVCPDAHHPFVDQLAWRTFLAAAREWRPDVLVIIGDFADCLSVSFHPKDPARKQSLKEEMDQVNLALDEVEALRIPRVEFMCGNHELRAQRYLWERAPELYGLVEISELLRIKARGWNWTPYRESLQIGKMHFAHDVGRCGKHTAMQSLADYGHSIVMGHSHRAATVYNGTVAGDRQVAMNVGTLIDIASVDYRHRAMAAREWQTGFGIVHMTHDGLGFCTFCPIIDGRTVVDGRVVSGGAA
jgi:hypothetical protein